MEELIEKHGRKMLIELMDLAMFVERPYDEKWLMFARKHGVVGRYTKTVTGYVYNARIERDIKLDENGMLRYQNVEPYTRYTIILKNGRSQDVLRVVIKSTDLPLLMEVTE